LQEIKEQNIQLSVLEGDTSNCKTKPSETDLKLMQEKDQVFHSL